MKDDALYLEVDEDITSAIDKLHKASSSRIQIVVPKRSTMLQSIINLKLLKKAAESDNKELVLVTGDRVATDLAGRVGLAVAPSIGAKAVVADTEVPEELKTGEEIIDESDPEPPPEEPAEAVAVAPVKSESNTKLPPLLRRRKITDDEPVAPAEPVAAAAAASTTSAKLPKVPNFGLLRKRLLWVGLVVIVIIGYFLVMYVFASAKVVLYASANRTDVSSTFTVSPSASGSSLAQSTLPGRTITVTHTLNGSFTPTGTQDIGSKAVGTMTIYNAYDENSHSFPAGQQFVAPDGNVFMSTAAVTVPGATTSLVAGHISINPGQATVSVQAAANGDTYNEAPASYTISGLPASEQSQSDGIYAKGDQMSGGVTKTVKVVAASDITSEQAALLAKDQSASASALAHAVPSGYMALTSSQSSAVSNVQPNPAVGAQATSGSLQLTVTYTELAVSKTAYRALVDAQEQQQIGASNQIYDDGLSTAQITAGTKGQNGAQSFSFTTEAFSGPKLNTASIAQQLAGHRYGDAANIATGLPGITQATINIWPSWDSTLPSRADKINVVIRVAKQ